MVKVISSGRCKQYRCTCKFCGCVFEYNIADVKPLAFNDDNSKSKSYIECPECNNIILLLI